MFKVNDIIAGLPSSDDVYGITNSKMTKALVLSSSESEICIRVLEHANADNVGREFDVSPEYFYPVDCPTSTVHNQDEWDKVPDDFKGIIELKNGENWVFIEKQKGYAIVIKEKSCVKSGSATVEASDSATVEASGSATVRAWGSATVRASGSATVRAWGSATVEASGSATVEASGSATVRAWGSATVRASDSATVEASDSATVEASGSATVRAWDSATVRASDSATVEASGSATVEAWGSATVEASGSATVRAWGSATVRAWGSATVRASGNVQIANMGCSGKLEAIGNARIVFLPRNLQEFFDFHGIEQHDGKVIMYKAVRGDDLHSSHTPSFIYSVGETKTHECNTDPDEGCGIGLHISTLHWALDFGEEWDDLRIIEVEVPIDKIVYPTGSNGKLRTSELKVLRVVPLEECGAWGKILAKKQKAAEKDD